MQNTQHKREYPAAICIVGLGGVGTALARALRQAAAAPLILVGKGRSRERNLARRLKVQYLSDLRRIRIEQGVVILAVRERSIRAAVRLLSKQPLPWGKIAVLHTSGPLGADVLKPLEALGAGIAAWHPFQTFPRAAAHVSFRDVTFGIEGNRRGERAARQMARLLGGRALRVAGEDRILYHAAAVMACGHVATQLGMAIEVLKMLGCSEQRAREVVLPIAEQTVRNVRALGVRKALTGPAARGDREIIRRHVRALAKAAPGIARTYQALSRGKKEHRPNRTAT